ncbi:MAG TPA: STAS domain-containing protein [Terriglobales bacterium]|jgi:anti-sigma B factor antagonist|nr:STAS domain-containing protein [Terriglobales bacterium]
METSKPVIVKRMPDRLNQRQARMFLHEVQPFLNTDRPQLVFDCSQIRQMDAAGVDMLLRCMAEVMKRDGELKLAKLSPQAAVILELTRTDRLFEIYESSGDAVKSFQRFLPGTMKNLPVVSPILLKRAEKEIYSEPENSAAA